MDTERPLPRNAIVAIACALLVYPGLMFVERASQPCGDGLCSFWPGAMVVVGLFVATFVFVLRSMSRGETPRWLLIVPWLIWALIARPMFL